MKTIEVVAAVITKDNTFLATMRSYGDFKGGYEFPGGKIEANETHEEALIREIKEELNLTIKVNNHIQTIEYDYPNFHLTMHCYFSEILSGNISLSCHSEYQWVTKDMLDTLNWLPADIDLVETLKLI